MIFENFDIFVQNLEIGKWLLSPNNSLSLICQIETPTFYQTLAGVTHCKYIFSKLNVDPCLILIYGQGHYKYQLLKNLRIFKKNSTNFRFLFNSVTEKEVLELEKRFWVLAGKSPSHRIDISILTPLVSPPLPPYLVHGLFQAFDENQVKFSTY